MPIHKPKTAAMVVLWFYLCLINSALKSHTEGITQITTYMVASKEKNGCTNEDYIALFFAYKELLKSRPYGCMH